MIENLKNISIDELELLMKKYNYITHAIFSSPVQENEDELIYKLLRDIEEKRLNSDYFFIKYQSKYAFNASSFLWNFYLGEKHLCSFIMLHKRPTYNKMTLYKCGIENYEFQLKMFL
jgi:hypothetical protein